MRIALVTFIAALLLTSGWLLLEGQAQQSASIAAVTGQKGGWDLTGPYDVVPDWPRPLSRLPGHENWTWGSVQGVFAESPNRVFIVQRGELPQLKRPATKAVPEFGPSLSFPVGGAPLRNASQGPASSPPGAGGPGADPDDPAQAWRGRMGIDARWEHLLLVFNAAGDVVEQWTQWDSLFKRPHSVYINPYDPEKHVWVVDDHSHAVFKFSNDGKRLVQTLGTPGKAGSDGAHFNRPTFLAWLPDSTLFVADGYNGTRVAKFDKAGKFLLTWGQRGESGKEKRPAYFNTVHGIAADPVTGVRERSLERTHPGVRRKRYVRRPVADSEPLEPAVPHRPREPRAVGVRRHDRESREVRHGGPLPVRMGITGRVSRRLLQHARRERRSGGQSLCRGSRRGASAEI
jgi:hypothetical protein